MDSLYNLFASFNFWSWFILMFGMQYSAGPGNILMATAVGKNGFRKTIPLLVGMWIPGITYTLLIGLGFNSISNEYETLFDVLTLIGTLYIFYLGYSFFKSTKVDSPSKKEIKLNFRDGFIVATFNGKLIAALLVMYPVALTDMSTRATIFLITALFFINGLVAQILWGFGGKLFSSMIGPDNLKTQNTIYGLLLIGVAIWMLYMLAETYI